VILLLGGEKSTQNKDIKKAKEYWADYKERQHYEET
jgi:putative component of toxin-antitoxin plasmid stabilization module